jgi:hypothetical protein
MPHVGVEGSGRPVRRGPPSHRDAERTTREAWRQVLPLPETRTRAPSCPARSEAAAHLACGSNILAAQSAPSVNGVSERWHRCAHVLKCCDGHPSPAPSPFPVCNPLAPQPNIITQFSSAHSGAQSHVSCGSESGVGCSAGAVVRVVGAGPALNANPGNSRQRLDHLQRFTAGEYHPAKLGPGSCSRPGSSCITLRGPSSVRSLPAGIVRTSSSVSGVGISARTCPPSA